MRHLLSPLRAPSVPTTEGFALLAARLRRLGDSGWTQGKAEAPVDVAVVRREPVPVRRPTKRGVVVEAASSAQAGRAR